MNPKQISKHGKLVWMINARSSKAGAIGRLYGATEKEVWEKYREALRGVGAIKFTDEDRLAKTELGEQGSLLLAVRYYLARRAQTTKCLTVFEAAPLWLAWMQSKNKSTSFVTNCKTVIGHFKTFLGNEGREVMVDNITNTMIDDFLAMKNGWSVETKNSVRGRLVNFFTYCVVQAKCCAVHPMKGGGVACIKPDKNARRPRPRIFSLDEIKQLFKTAQTEMPHMIPYLALGLFCGIRPDRNSEMGRIQKGDIDLRNGRVDVMGKGGERTVRLVQSQRIKVQQVDGSMSEQVMEFGPALAWLRVAPALEVVMDRYWRRLLCEKADVQWSSDVMRHTFASCHYHFFKSDVATAEEMGHDRSMKMLKRHYLNRDAEEFAEAFWKLTPDALLQVVPEAKVAA